MRRFVFCLSALLALATGATAAQGPWILPLTPVTLSPGPDSFEPQIAVAPDGTAVAVWKQYNGTNNEIAASRRPPGGVFSAAIPLSVTGSQFGADTPQVAVGPDGATTVVWARGTGGSPAFIIEQTTRAPGGTFSTPQQISTTGSAENPHVAFLPDGSTTVVWQEFAGSGNQNIMQTTRPPGGSFGTRAVLSSLSSGLNVQAQLAVGGDGTTAVVWQSPGSANTPVAAVRPPSGSFGAEIPLFTSSTTATATPQVAVAGTGEIAVVWSRSNGTNAIIEAVTRPAGGPSFGSIAQLSETTSAGNDAVDPQIAAAKDGTVVVVWKRTTATGPTVEAIEASARPPGGSFPLPAGVSTVSVPSVGAARPQVAFASDGSAVAAWERSPVANVTVLESSVRPPGGSFAADIDLSSPPAGHNPGMVQLAIAPDETTTAVWERTVGGNQVIETASSGNPPVASVAPSVSGTATSEQTVTCNTGTWNGGPTFAIAWLREGGAIGTGSTLGLTDADVGKNVACRVTATTPFGSTEATSAAVVPAGAPVAVTPPPPPPASSTPPAPPPPALPKVLSRAKIGGTARVGKSLSCTGATFEFTTSRRTEWLRDKKVIRGATKNRYTLKSADKGKNITCRVIGTGLGGKATTTSKAVRVK